MTKQLTGNERAVVERHQANAPIDITALAEDLGLFVFGDFALEEGVSGMITKDPASGSSSGYSISVNANEPYTRQRFTIAHECAHFLLHKSKIGDGISDDAMYRSEKMNSSEEFEANNCAAELLMPKKLMDSFVQRGVVDVEFLADAFEVSQPAMKVRMRYLYRLAF